MTYYTININNMSDTSKVYYLADLVNDLKELIENPNTIDKDQIMVETNKALAQLHQWANNNGKNIEV